MMISMKMNDNYYHKITITILINNHYNKITMTIKLTII